MFNLHRNQAAEELRKARPELTDRLVPLNIAKPPPGPIASLDVTVAKQKLGLPSFITWKQTLLDAVDSLLALEEKWNSSA